MTIARSLLAASALSILAASALAGAPRESTYAVAVAFPGSTAQVVEVSCPSSGVSVAGSDGRSMSFQCVKADGLRGTLWVSFPDGRKVAVSSQRAADTSTDDQEVLGESASTEAAKTLSALSEEAIARQTPVWTAFRKN